MKNFRNLLLALATFLFISCGSLELTSSNDYDMNYDYYNYNQIHLLYTSNPRWFYDNYYIDNFGRQRYCHTHPYYIRYIKQRDRKIKRNSHSVTTRTTRVAPTFTHTNPNDPRTVTRTSSTHRNGTLTSSPGRRTYSIQGTRSTSAPVIVRNQTRSTVKPTPRTVNPQRNNIRRNTSNAIKHSTPTHTVRSKTIQRTVPQRVIQRRSSKEQ